ncbi:MAG: hypothetical protein MJE68_19280 [Proteobacteria bacterium]|nr:hypothetical protein [Pseudomonadota bacterium]
MSWMGFLFILLKFLTKVGASALYRSIGKLKESAVSSDNWLQLKKQGPVDLLCRKKRVKCATVNKSLNDAIKFNSHSDETFTHTWTKYRKTVLTIQLKRGEEAAKGCHLLCPILRKS